VAFRDATAYRRKQSAAWPDIDTNKQGVSDPLDGPRATIALIEGGRSRPNCSLRRRSGGGTKRRLVSDLEVREAECCGEAPDSRADAISLRRHAERAIPAQKSARSAELWCFVSSP